MADSGNEIKVGICMAYDWYFLRDSLPLIYPWADKIVLSVDKEKVSWAGNSFFLDEAKFRSFVQEIDTQNKIAILEDNFHRLNSPMKNEVYQRNAMADELKPGGWHIQIDTDEYFLDFKSFVKYLNGYSSSKRNDVNICCPLITLFKKVSSGYLYIDNPKKAVPEMFPIATRQPHYTFGRRNGYFNVHTTFGLLHQSWARSEDEVWKKVSNWGHARDFDIEAYYQLWRSLDSENYQSYVNIHPIEPSLWPSLCLIESESIEDCIRFFRDRNFSSLSNVDLMIKNSRTIARIRSLIQRMR